MKLKVITHEKVLLDIDNVQEIYSVGPDGSFGVLKDHIPFITPLEIGVTKFVTDKDCEFITTMGGIFEFSDNVATILTDVAEFAKDIDVTRAKAAKERAEARLKAQEENLDIIRAQVALTKAIARISATEKKF